MVDGIPVARTGWVRVCRSSKMIGWDDIRWDEDRPTDELPMGWQWLRIIVRLDHDDFR